MPAIFWFRRDLRLDDNAGLYHALKSGHKVLPLFIFDRNILEALHDRKDARVTFILQAVNTLNKQLNEWGSSLTVLHDTPGEAFSKLLEQHTIQAVYTNRDYEPYALKRDTEITRLLQKQDIPFFDFKDQVIFEKDEVTKDDKQPYTVFTPYSRKWKASLSDFHLKSYPVEKYKDAFVRQAPGRILSLEQLGFEKSSLQFPGTIVADEKIKNYDKTRDIPSLEGTSDLGIHLRFGTISIRELARRAGKLNEIFLNELIWRDFFQMILSHFPRVVNHAFKPDYDKIKWRYDEADFKRWCEGNTGYPIVDAGMRQLNETGTMHNRVRMITASFLSKHLLIDWRWGEGYFAEKLLDYDLAANNGNWQWAAGCGCDAAPYFRVFNPRLQTEKFDPELKYIRKWVPEFGTDRYPEPMVEHTAARDRCLKVYKEALKKE